MITHTRLLLLLLPLALTIGCGSSDDGDDSAGLMLDDGSSSATDAEVPLDPDVPADDTEATVGNGLEGGLLEGTPPESGSSDTSAVAGFWDFSMADGSDVQYHLISSNGSITVYDYDQDPAGEGQNCYYIQQDTLTPLGADQYEFGETPVTLQVVDGNLLVTRPESDGEAVEVLPLVGIDPIDLTPCEGTIF